MKYPERFLHYDHSYLQVERKPIITYLINKKDKNFETKSDTSLIFNIITFDAKIFDEEFWGPQGISEDQCQKFEAKINV